MARSRKPLVAQNEVLARTLAQQSKSQIAREMNIDRQTVTRIQEHHNLPQLLADSRQFIVEKVVPDAIHSLHAQIIDRDAPGDGDLAARLLERSGVLDGASSPTYNIEGDVLLQQGLALLRTRSNEKPSGVHTPAGHNASMSANAAPALNIAAQNGRGLDRCETLHEGGAEKHEDTGC